MTTINPPLRRTKVIPKPEQETPPNVWEMPATGIEWCDCGEHHEVDEKLVTDAINAALDEDVNESITHKEVCKVIMHLWNFYEVCAFFHDHVKLSARKVNGKVAEEYKLSIGKQIIAYFCKTWQGCPEEACEGGFGDEGPSQ